MLASYLLVRFLTLPFAFLPYRAIHFCGRRLGTLAYYLIPKFRKRALSNLALAKDLALSNSEIRKTAKGSLQSLMITLLEYPKLAREKNIAKIAQCENPEEANTLMAQGKGVVFFCGHQANWELLFLEGTSRMPGVAIGRPIKNHYLYSWIQSIREKFGGKIVSPKNGIKEGLRALKKGAFMGIVGDQGMPDSGFSSPFLGRKAWTSPVPAMLSYKTGAPLIVATTKRKRGKYLIHFSPALFPRKEKPMEEEVRRLMESALGFYEESIKKRPHEWLWIHNRWKQQTPDRLKKAYRHDSIALVLDEQIPTNLEQIRQIYPTEEITVFAPKTFKNRLPIKAHIHSYEDIEEILVKEYRHKLLFNFTKNRKVERHFKRYATQTICHPKSIEELKKICLRNVST